jgi:hypothetical protein
MIWWPEFPVQASVTKNFYGFLRTSNGDADRVQACDNTCILSVVVMANDCHDLVAGISQIR